MEYKLVGGRDTKFCNKINKLFNEGWTPLREHLIPGLQVDNPNDKEFLPFIMMILEKPKEKEHPFNSAEKLRKKEK